MKIEYCIYLNISGSKFIFLLLYVGDIFLASNDVNLLFETKKLLSKTFEMKDMDDAYILGIEIKRDRSKGLLALSHK